MTLPLSPKRMDRLPLHFDRWKGPMSIVIQLNEEEMENVAKIVSAIQRENVRFTFYIIKKPIPETRSYRCTFISYNRTKVHYETCFVINVLRNLAIETIRTTHFMIVDGDGIVSCIMYYLPIT